MMNQPIKVSAHGFDVIIEPDHGALVRAITWRAPDGRMLPLLHSPADGEITIPHGTIRFGAWPMVPFANRAFGGRLVVGDETFQLPLNSADGKSTIHGFGWQNPWQILAHASDGATIGHERGDYERREVEDPFRYRATMNVQIEPDCVLVELAVVNRASRPLPYGLGLHPWFPRDADTTFSCTARGSIRLGNGFMPGDEAPLPKDIDLTGREPLPVDREFGASLLDWTGESRVNLPGRGYAIGIDASDNFRHPVLWSPLGADFVCFEPQSHAVGAPSEPHVQKVTPLTMLKPGESMGGWMRLRPYLIG